MPENLRSTFLWKVNANSPDPEVMSRAGQILRKGGLVAFPTETVYGLGANALDAAAVGEIFAAKNRPADNPLIVHLAGAEEVNRVAGEVSAMAETLIQAFWPGPLTLVLPGKNNLPVEVTAGLNTVAVRMPGHEVALALFREAGVPVAAPSANASGRPSPTSANHVMADLEGLIDLVLDSGPAGVGVESTVVDATGEKPVILRPGGITPGQIEKVTGAVKLYPGLDGSVDFKVNKPRSPGLLHRHYAPGTPLILVEGKQEKISEVIKNLFGKYTKEGKKVGILCHDDSSHNYRGALVKELGSRSNSWALAANLYSALRKLDNSGLDVILAEGTGEDELGFAVMNRLRRAAEEIIEAK